MGRSKNPKSKPEKAIQGAPWNPHIHNLNNIKLLPMQQNIILIPVPILKKALVNDQRHVGGLTGAKVEDQVLLRAGGRPESMVRARFDTDLAALGGEHALGPFHFDCHLA